MPKRRRRLGRFEHKERASVVVDLACTNAGRKMLQLALRTARPRHTCHDVVVECAGRQGERHARLHVRALCTTPKSKAEFVDLAEGYAKSVKDMLE